MIELTRLNGHSLLVNSDLIKFVENAPDTVITLATGEKIVVLESGQQILEKVVEFRRRLISAHDSFSLNPPTRPPKQPQS